LKLLTQYLAWIKDESGATAIEYAVIASAMAIVLFPLLATMSSSTGGLFQLVLNIFDHPMFDDGYFS
jgi:Flp pilus assembly pilin Flp